MILENVKNLMSEGFNCSQIVFMSAADELGISKETAVKTAGCFGGGMSCGELCGAITGGLMALGVKYGNSAPGEMDKKEFSKIKAVEYMNLFKKQYECVHCKEILGYDFSIPEQAKEAKEKGIVAKTCPEIVTYATVILKQVL